MLYDPRLLFAQISVILDQTPARSLRGLSRELRVGTRTIQDVVAVMTGKEFKGFKDDILIARLTRLFLAKPASPIQELVLDLGYKSSGTFARAVHRACGVSPADLRKRIISGLVAQSSVSPKAPTIIH